MPMEAKPIAQWESDHPIPEQVPNHWGSRISKPPQRPCRDSLEAVENLKYRRNGEQGDCKGDDRRIDGIEPRNLTWKYQKGKGGKDLETHADEDRRPPGAGSSR